MNNLLSLLTDHSLVGNSALVAGSVFVALLILYWMILRERKVVSSVTVSPQVDALAPSLHAIHMQSSGSEPKAFPSPGGIPPLNEIPPPEPENEVEDDGPTLYRKFPIGALFQFTYGGRMGEMVFLVYAHGRLERAPLPALGQKIEPKPVEPQLHCLYCDFQGVMHPASFDVRLLDHTILVSSQDPSFPDIVPETPRRRGVGSNRAPAEPPSHHPV